MTFKKVFRIKIWEQHGIQLFPIRYHNINYDSERQAERNLIYVKNNLKENLHYEYQIEPFYIQEK